MKRKKILSAGVIMLVVSAIIVVNGCRPHKRGIFLSENFPENILKRIDSKVAELNLNSAQQEEYNNIREKMKADLIEGRDQRLRNFDEINDELNMPNPDVSKIVSMVKKFHAEGSAKRNEKFNEYADTAIEFYNMLDEEQKSIVIEKLRDAAKRFDHR